MRKLLLALLLCSPAWGQYNFQETFEGSGEGCALVETWPDTPLTVTTDTGLSGACNLTNPSTTRAKAGDGLSLDRGCFLVQYRFGTTPGGNTVIIAGRDSGDANRASLNHHVGLERFTFANSGGTAGTLSSVVVAVDTKYEIEMCGERDLDGGGASAKVKARARIVGNDWEDWVETTNGTWTAVIENWGIAGVSGISDERFDNITACYGTYVGLSECEPPAALISDTAVIEGFYPDLFDIQPQSLPEGEPNEVYPGAQFVALNGNLPHTWAVSGGSLPEGLSLSSGGALTGTPATGAGGTHNFTVEATDADGGLAHRDFSIVVQSEAAAVQQPWQRDFTPLRTHYVSASGSGNGSIGSPESFATARGHCKGGDLHIMRGGTYAGNFDTSCDGTSTNPIVWRGHIDANGDPEHAYIDGGWRLSGDWQWLQALHFGDDDSSASQDYGVELFARGTAVVNSIVYGHCDLSGVAPWNVGAGQLLYGVVIKNTTRCDSTLRPHNIYTQNIYEQNGWKYFIQVISLDVFNIEDAVVANQILNNGWAPGTGARGTGFHIQDSTFQQGRINFGQHTGFSTGDQPSSRMRWHRNWYDSGFAPHYWKVGDQVPAQWQVTDSLFRNTRISFVPLWGASDACHTYPEESRFTGNEIYDPADTTIYMHVATQNYSASCNRNSIGAAKLRNADVFNNNTFGRTNGAGTFSLTANGSSSTTLTLAQYRTASSAARQTPGTAFDASSTEVTTPTTDRVECFDNSYQAGWGYCRAINFDGNSSVVLPAAEVQKIVGSGKTYKVRNVRDFYGTPLESGTYTAGSGITVSPLPGDMVNGVLIVWITSQP